MDKAESLCGYRCSECAIYVENKLSDDEKRRACEDFKRLYGFDLTPADLECVGCKNEGKHVDTACPVRPCALAKGVADCAHCDEFICERLKERIDFVDRFLKDNFDRLSREDLDRYVKPYDSKATMVELRQRLRAGGSGR